jgi:hypothetical protein
VGEERCLGVDVSSVCLVREKKKPLDEMRKFPVRKCCFV